ncbi:hypothetical protein KSP40_PGU018209 [Platanthera guangdongensis]|uniref:Uncharacterized protein n=1 Tax=Platanthera guangdongensis TaxID=2320717 RepID=A0ABR2LH75_9ASPA
MHESLRELLRCVQLRAAGNFGKHGAVSLLQQTPTNGGRKKGPLKLECAFFAEMLGEDDALNIAALYQFGS